VTARQLLELGVGEHGIYERVRTGRLLRLYRGVYAVGHEQLRRDGRWLAAVLACGPGAALSHQSAAALWEIRPSASAVIHLTVPTQSGRVRRKGLRVHRSGRIGLDEVTVKDGLPVSTVARTLLDLADVLPRQDLKRAIHESEYKRLFDLTAITAVVHANPGRRGKRLLTLAQGPSQLTRSELERRFLSLVERRRFPDPVAGAWVEGYEVDFLWRQANLVVELDGYAVHTTRAAFQRDREKDRRLTAAGYRPIRITATDLRNERRLADELAALLRS
jgi:very-short-patch-repair endonuclease